MDIDKYIGIGNKDNALVCNIKYLVLFYNLIFDKDITGDFVINKFKKSFNDLFLSPVDNEIKNESNYIIKIPDIISINKNCFLLECICCNNNLVSLKQIENDIKIYTKNNAKYNIENKENILINKRQFNNKYKLYEEPENKELPVVSFIYDILNYF